jgi:Flp pilus assembly protein TadB
MSIYFVYFGILAAALLAFEAFAITLGERRRRSATVNRRLKILQSQQDSRSALTVLRRERLLDDTGNYLLPYLESLNRLFVQTGLTRKPSV